MVVVVLSAGVEVVVLVGVIVVGNAVVVEELDGDEVSEDDGSDVGDGCEEGDDNVGEWDKV
jgi:hypothetical protein